MEQMINISKIQISSVIIPSNNDIENFPYLLLKSKK